MKQISKILILFIALFFVLLLYFKLLPGMPEAVDTGSHLFRLIYLNKNLEKGTVPLWNTDWYAGAPFLLLYAPLAYYFSSFWLIKDYLLLYKILDVIFEFFIVVGVYILSKQVLKRIDIALLSTFLFVIAPQNIWNFSVNDRFATLLEAFFIICGLLFLLNFLSSQRKRDKIISGIFFGLAFLSQGFGFFIILMVLSFLKIIAWKSFKFKDLFTIVFTSILISLPWLILSAGSFVYYSLNPYKMTWAVREYIDIPRIAAVAFSLGLPLVTCLFFKTKLLKRLKYVIAIILILLSFFVFFINISLKFNITKPIISLLTFITAMIILTVNYNTYDFEKNVTIKYVYYLSILLVILSCSLFLYSFTFLSFLDPYRIAFYTSIPLSIASAYILQKNKLGLILSIITLLILSSVFLSNYYIQSMQIDENLIKALRDAPDGRLLIIESARWMHIIPALTGKQSIDGFCPFERFLPYFRNLGFSNNFGMWFEGTTLEQKQEVYNQVFLNVSKYAIKYIMIQDNSPIKLPIYLDYETLYKQDGWNILMLKQPVSFIENGSLVTISPNELIIYPTGNTIFLKQTYFPGWQASCGNIKKSQDGLTIIENDNCEEIKLKYNPLSALPQLLTEIIRS